MNQRRYESASSPADTPPPNRNIPDHRLILNGFFGLSPALTRVQAQNRIIIINADQPNVWTLEQAHYLLAQMHRRNLDLRTANLEALDPNEIAGLRFDVLRSLVEFGVSFDDANEPRCVESFQRWVRKVMI